MLFSLQILKMAKYRCDVSSSFLVVCLFVCLVSQSRAWQSVDELVNVETLESSDVENLTLYQRPELAVTLTKLHAWRLTRLSKCVFLDADTLVSMDGPCLFGICRLRLGCVRVCVCVCVCTCTNCAHARVRVCVCACICVTP